ncbi:MAG: antitoxin family protein [Candidatus Contendobacter sp.]|nr:antitoxin family protein [Candidatus Contendobacter sp.]MDG4557934.1 antitoxin family protein [Candidatus Contendobacter sp.]
MTQHLKAIYEGGVFWPLEPVHLPEHQEVTLLLETSDETRPRADAGKPIWEVAAELVRDIPEDALNALPTDGAAQHDHYLYGAAKRP